MNIKLMRKAFLALMMVSASFIARSEDAPMLVVVDKDGNYVETKITDVSRVDFDTFDFSVLSKDGSSAKYDYEDVKRIEFGITTGIVLPDYEFALAVWPTVTSSNINVSGTDARRIFIYDLNGVCAMNVMATSDVTTIDVSGLSAGHYILRAGNNSVRFIKK